MPLFFTMVVVTTNITDKNRVAFRSTTDLFDDDLPKPDLKENNNSSSSNNNSAPVSPSSKQQQQQQQQQKHQGEPQQLQQINNNSNNASPSAKKSVEKKRALFLSTSEESLAEALNSVSRQVDIPDDFAMGTSQPHPDEKDELPELLDDDDTLHRAKELSDFGLIQ